MKIGTQVENKRPRRTAINGSRGVLNVKGKDPNYEYRIVNDDRDRIAEFQELGYEVVTDNTIKVGDKRVANPTAEGSPVKVNVGGGASAYLMRIKKEFYEEDQAQKQALINEQELQMHKEAKKNADFGTLSLGKQS